jgi:hypothetical protein
MVYTAEQVLDASPEWEQTLLDRFGAHPEAFCPDRDWSSDTPEVRALIARFRASKCKGFVTACKP